MGGSSGGSGGGTQVVTQNTQPWSGVSPWLTGGQVSVPDPNNPFVGRTREIPGAYELAFNRYQSEQPQFFPGSTVAGFDPWQTQAQDRTAQLAMAGNPALNATQGTAAGYAAGDFSNPAIQGAIDAARRSVQPGIDSRFMQSGRSWSPAHAQALGRGVADATAPLIFGAQQNAMGMAPGLAQAAYIDPNMLSSAGGQRQAMAQAGINEQMARHDFEQNREAMKIGQYAAILAGLPGGNISTTTGPMAPVGGGKGSPLGTIGGLLGGAGSAAQGYGALSSAGVFSDRRLKRDVSRVGMWRGHNLYRYRYLWSDDWHLGVMADEVEHTGAVFDVGGYKAVDYGRL